MVSTQADQKQKGVYCVLEVFPSEMGCHYSKSLKTFFNKTSMRFDSAMATLDPQKYVIARTVWTENILLVSGRLVFESYFV